MTFISLLGAAPDTGNLGVNALSHSIAFGILERIPNADLCIFDNGRGMRRGSLRIGNAEKTIRMCGLSNSRRIYRRESLAHMRLSQFFPGLLNPGLRAIAQSRAVLDISGGDSFTDLYGARRFDLISQPKKIALREKRPLILLPQTYGPFREKKNRKLAADILRQSHSAWARDTHSFDVLVDLLGADFDRSRHRCGVDVAFLLPALRPVAIERALESWLAEEGTEVVGLNVSGLIYNGGHAAARQYGIKADYVSAVEQLVEKILKTSNAKILLVPHVKVQPHECESDLRACRRVIERFGSRAEGRLQVLEGDYNEMEIKWIIAQLQWFCGTRMHSTIAALSSGVPSAAISYSDKTRGVFGSCEQQAQVFDPRVLDTGDLVDGVFTSFEQRSNLKKPLQKTLPQVIARARDQMDTIAGHCVAQ